jgi:AmmeMemoRadiSam system protein A
LSAPPDPAILQSVQGAEALRIARAAVESWVLRGETCRLASSETGLGEIRAPAFVSLYRQGQLRGCVGTLEPSLPLPQVLIEISVAAAVRDPRFPPLTRPELEATRLEISVLTSPAALERAEEIVVGRDGIVVEKAGRKSLLLPQVALQHRWSREQFLEQACLKAGLPLSAWREGARIAVFQAQVFAEPESDGVTTP